MVRQRLAVLSCVVFAADLYAQELWFLPYEPDDRTVCLFHFDGKDAVEKSAAALPIEGSLRGDAARGPGRFGQGLVLKGPKQHLRLGKHEALKLGRNEPFTIELWCRPEANAEAGLISVGTRFYLKLHPGRRTAIFGYRAASFPIRWFPCANVPWQRRQWQHVALTHDASRRARIFINGKLAAETTHKDEGDYAKGSSGAFGAHDGWTAFFVGSIDEIRISRGARSFRPLLKHTKYLPGEPVELNFDAGRLPASVTRVRAEILPRRGKPLWRAEYGRDAVPEALLPAGKLPPGRNTLRLTFIDGAGETISSASAGVEFVGQRIKDIASRVARCEEAAAKGKQLLPRYVQQIERFIGERKLLEAEQYLAAAEHVARRAQQGETTYREQLRRAVRAQPCRNNVRITMSWSGASDQADSAIPWAKRIGANELVSSLGRSDPAGIRKWKRAGYRTVALSGTPIHDHHWTKEHADDSQFGYWANDPTRAEGAALRMKIVSPTWGGETISTVHDPKEHWLVKDVTTNRPVPPAQWRYDEKKREVVLDRAQSGHRYRVYFMIRTHGTGDPLRESFVKRAVAHLEETVAPFEGVLDTYWFDDLGFAYPGPVPQGGWDWESYTLAAHPENQRRFARDTGIAFSPEWLVMAPRTIELAPHRNYLAWMAWVQKGIRVWMPKATDIIRKHGMTAWLYWGDCHVGIEPFLGSVSAGKVDEIDKPAGDAVTARALVDFPGDTYRRMRVDWLHGHTVSTPKSPARFRTRWDQSKRGLLMKPIRGIYWMPFPNVAKVQIEPLREDMAETISDISDEFRFIGEKLAGHRAYTHDIDVYVAHSWGKVYSWRPWGAPVLVHLTDLPVRVHFISFAEIEQDGVPEDADVLFGYGVPNSSWSGGHFWRSPRLVKAVDGFVRRGGGLVALQAWSHVEDPKPRWALADVLGLTGEGTQRFATPKADESMVADVGDAELAAAAGSDALIRTRDGRRHWVSSGLPTVIPRLSAAVQVSPLRQDGNALFAVKRRRGAASLGVVARTHGKGRVVYIAGQSQDFAFTRLIRRAFYWAARHEADSDRLSIEGDDWLFVYAYPRARTLALFSANAESKRVTVRCAPDVFGLAPDAAVRLVDVTNGERVFAGAAESMARGFRVNLVPSCVRLLALEQ